MPVLTRATEIAETTRRDFTEALVPYSEKNATTRQSAEIRLNGIPASTRIVLLLETWNVEDAKRIRRLRKAIGLFLVLLGSLIAFFPFLFLNGKFFFFFLPFQILVHLFERLLRLSYRQKGMLSLLRSATSPYLVAPFLDSFRFTWGETQEALRQQLTLLLPGFTELDHAPLNAHQQSILIGELRRLRQGFGALPILSPEKQDFTLAALQILLDQTCGRQRRAFMAELRKWQSVGTVTVAEMIFPPAVFAHDCYTLLAMEKRDKSETKSPSKQRFFWEIRGVFTKFSFSDGVDPSVGGIR